MKLTTQALLTSNLLIAEFSIDPTQDEDETYLAHLEELTAIHQSKRLMKLTFTGRRSWIQKDTPSVSEIIDVFPALRQSNRVSNFTMIQILSKVPIIGLRFSAACAEACDHR